MLIYRSYAESILSHDPHIAAAIMFGNSRFQNGVLVDTKQEYEFDPRDEEKLAEFRNKIWCADRFRRCSILYSSCVRPSVEKLNAFAPAHSRLFKEVSDERLYFKTVTLKIW